MSDQQLIPPLLWIYPATYFVLCTSSTFIWQHPRNHGRILSLSSHQNSDAFIHMPIPFFYNKYRRNSCQSFINPLQVYLKERRVLQITPKLDAVTLCFLSSNHSMLLWLNLQIISFPVFYYFFLRLIKNLLTMKKTIWFHLKSPITKYELFYSSLQINKHLFCQYHFIHCLLYQHSFLSLLLLLHLLLLLPPLLLHCHLRLKK